MVSLKTCVRRGVLATLCLGGFGWSASAETTIRVGGTGAPLAALAELGARFAEDHPDVTVTVLPSLGSGGGIRAVRDRVIDVAVSSRPVRDDEGAGSTLIVQPFARTAVTVLTSLPGGASVTTDGLAGLIADPHATWPDGTPVHVILRPETETDIHEIADDRPVIGQALATARARPEVPVAATDQENMDLAADLPGALTVGTLLQMRAEGWPLYPVTIDGQAASGPAVADGTYPVTKDFALVVRTDASETALAFIGFLRGEQAAAYIRSLDAIPLR
ncbi:substrate-binding domain-containing protein [Roseospira navarrensis]|uniref:PBP domain-containing protein n=1 Tax=Roseospira navarrensis TaxID=140058 RepID=A0A7X1ZIE3_9PROT|nr:substrate-binding domain-containing protein [Roseospira navarrensis]MQX37815.1 hypothetical protein [Roseospira navarrensis]